MEKIAPLPGVQTQILSNPADILVSGGGAGPGKTFCLLLDAVRHIHVSGYGAVIFRRESKQITIEGGLRDTAMQIYPHLGGIYRSQPSPHFVFPAYGTTISFAHLNEVNEVQNWQGSQVPFIGFDEGTHFELSQIEYMLSRNRSVCGVKPVIRITCNPDADSWLAEFIEWWIDQESGYPIKERSGALRYMVRIGGKRMWGDSPQELVETYGCELNDAKSVSFVPARITDNAILMQKDPGYIANLKALNNIERARLLDGNWKIRVEPGMIFPRDDAVIIDWVPNDITHSIRSWDLAASEERDGTNPDWTVGMKLCRRANGLIIIVDVIRVRRKAAAVRSLLINCANNDTKNTPIVLPQDPGQSGKDQAETYRGLLKGYRIISRTITKNKVAMANDVSAAWQRGEVQMVRAPWNKALIEELDGFPSKVLHDDQVDALSGGYRNLGGAKPVPNYSKSGLSGKYIHKPSQFS